MDEMSGVREQSLSSVPVPELVRTVMGKFGVDEKTAGLIISFSNTLAMKRMEKWRRNFCKIYKNKAEDLYKLVKELGKVAGNGLLMEIEKKVLEMCVEG